MDDKKLSARWAELINRENLRQYEAINALFGIGTTAERESEEVTQVRFHREFYRRITLTNTKG